MEIATPQDRADDRAKPPDGGGNDTNPLAELVRNRPAPRPYTGSTSDRGVVIAGGGPYLPSACWAGYLTVPPLFWLALRQP